MDRLKLADIRKKVIFALFSDDELMNVFVLKGGSAIDVAYAYPSGRASLDVDLSMKGEFSKEKLIEVKERVHSLLNQIFNQENYNVIDLKLAPRPLTRKSRLPHFWGGYKLKFKLVSLKRYRKHQNDKELLSKLGEDIGRITPKGSQRKDFEVDISAWEFCDDKREVHLDGFTFYVYSPELLVAEKLRTICQQMNEYPYGTKRPRARDFYDIHVIVENAKDADWRSERLSKLVKNAFRAKEVPLKLLEKVSTKETKIYHAVDFVSVRATLPAGVEKKLKDFDFYFQYVVDFIVQLESLWIK